MGTYSRGTYVTLPTDDGDLTTVMSAGEVSDLATINNVFVAQNLSNQIAAQQYKNTCSASLANLLWVGQSDLAPSISPITLEAYNYSTAAWVGQATNAAAATNATCTLGVTLGTTQYISPGGYTTGRVYQSSAAAPGWTVLTNQVDVSDHMTTRDAWANGDLSTHITAGTATSMVIEIVNTDTTNPAAIDFGVYGASSGNTTYSCLREVSVGVVCFQQFIVPLDSSSKFAYYIGGTTSCTIKLVAYSNVGTVNSSPTDRTVAEDAAFHDIDGTDSATIGICQFYLNASASLAYQVRDKDWSTFDCYTAHNISSSKHNNFMGFLVYNATPKAEGKIENTGGTNVHFYERVYQTSSNFVPYSATTTPPELTTATTGSYYDVDLSSYIGAGAVAVALQLASVEDSSGTPTNYPRILAVRAKGSSDYGDPPTAGVAAQSNIYKICPIGTASSIQIYTDDVVSQVKYLGYFK